jgi:hypothetical protein
MDVREMEYCSMKIHYEQLLYLYSSPNSVRVFLM